MNKNYYEMNRLKITLSFLLLALLMPQLNFAQSFSWNIITNTVITEGTPVSFTSTVSDVGVLNSTEGKSPILILSIDHVYVGDVSISLTSPEGTTVDVTSNNGGSGDDYTATVFRQDVSTSITAGSPPFTGNFLPEQSFALFDGENADGVWTMTITDNNALDDGMLVAGNLTMNENQFFSYALDDFSIDSDGGTAFSNDLVLPSSGVTWTENIHNQPNSALDFDGTNYVEASNQSFPDDGVTFAVWVKPSIVNADMKVISITDNFNPLDLVSLGILNGQADFEVINGNSSGRITTGSLTSGEWVHLAGTWSTADDLLRLYINGVLVGTTQGPTSLSFIAPPTQFEPVIGAAAWDPSALRFEGVLDDIRVYGIAFNEHRIKDIVANFNQYCFTAVELPVEGNSCSGNYYAHNYGGNGVNGPTTNCSGNNGGASWFTVTVPTSGNLTISSENVAGSDVTDNVIEVYSGACRNLTYLDCADDVNGGFAEVTLTGLTPGDVLTVKSWESANNDFGQYVMCAFDPEIVGIEDHVVNVEDIALQVYPNPASNQIQVVAEFNTSKELDLQIVNVLGKVIHNESIGETTLLNTSVDVSEFSNGVYFLSIQSKDKIYTQRFVVKK